MLEDLSARHIRGWEIYYSTKPFGTQIGFYQTGIICAVLANLKRDPKKRARPFEAEDFIPSIYKMGRKSKDEKQTVKQQIAILDSISVPKKRMKKDA